MKKILIGGIGSVLLGDDGVGPYVIRLLEAQYAFDEGVTVADLGTPGLDLVAHLSGQDALILIDSVANGAPPGTVTLYERTEIMKCGPAPVRMDPHSPVLSESLLIAELGGQDLRDVVLIGITGKQYEVGTGLSEVVRRAAHQAVSGTLTQLNRFGVRYWKFSEADTSCAWWEAMPKETEAGGASLQTQPHAR
jgi:hydrogenase maturation protease